MNELILPGVLGLLTGLLLRWTRLCQPGGLRSALALRVSHPLRSLVMALGAGVALTALLMWLAVIDVDKVTVLPLSAGVLAGGAVFGAAAALSGYTPLTAFAACTGRHAIEALCTLAGCLAGTLLLPLLDAPLAALRSLPPIRAATVFAVTLDEPFLLGGGHLAQGCAGLLVMAIAMCIPSNRRRAVDAMQHHAPVPAGPAPVLCLPAPQEASDPQDAPQRAAGDAPAPGPEEPPAPEPSPTPDDASPDEADAPSPDPEPAFIALLPGEEPLVVDTLPAEDDSPEPAPEPEAPSPVQDMPMNGDVR